MMLAALGLLKTKNPDAKADHGAVFADFKRQFIDTGVFFERYIGNQEWPYYQAAHEAFLGKTVHAGEDDDWRSVDEVVRRSADRDTLSVVAQGNGLRRIDLLTLEGTPWTGPAAAPVASSATARRRRSRAPPIVRSEDSGPEQDPDRCGRARSRDETSGDVSDPRPREAPRHRPARRSRRNGKRRELSRNRHDRTARGPSVVVVIVPEKIGAVPSCRLKCIDCAAVTAAVEPPIFDVCSFKPPSV